MKFGKEIQFEINEDLIDCGITTEIKEISKQLERMYLKSNATAVKDFLKDLYEGFDVFKKLKEDGDDV